MFSGIHSLFFGKKHKHKGEDSSESQASVDNDFVILERRHSDEYDKNSGIYPDLDPSNPSSSNLPYTASPSLPNLNEVGLDSGKKKEEPRIDMLQAVPFELSPEILLLDEENNKEIDSIIDSLNDIKDSGDDSFLENFSYDFELEHSISLQFS